MEITFCNHQKCPFLLSGIREIEENVLTALKEMLPQEHKYIICRCKGNEREFDVVLRADIKQMEQAIDWKNEFETKTKTTWRTERTYPGTQTKVLFKEAYRCQHNTKPRSSTADARKSSKNTGCESKIKVIVYKSVIPLAVSSDKKARASRSKDPHRLEYPTEIEMTYRHNHPIHTAAALKFRDVSEETQEKIDCLLLDGYAPHAALEKIKFDLQLEDPDNYVMISADRALCPDLDWVYKRSYALGSTKNNRNDCSESLKAFVESVNFSFMKGSSASNENTHFPGSSDSLKKQHAAMEVSANDQIIVAICTPLMHRVHEMLMHSGELVFIDSTKSVERSGLRAFLLITHSCAGGLPLGVIITSGESTNTITGAFKLLSKIIGPSAFFGRGQKGPLFFMTDDSKTERTALGEVFPESAQFLCAFRLLQAFWRYLWDQKTQVHRDQRKHIFCLVKDILYASEMGAMERCIEKALYDEILCQYEHVKGYVKKNLLDRKRLWALCFREGLLGRGKYTTNFCEAAMCVLKDQILQRTKAFNGQQLVDFVCHDLEAYYSRRCVDIASNQLSHVVHSRYLISTEHIDDDLIAQVGEDSDLQFDVKSTSDPTVTYRVDMTVGLCTCKAGNTGGPCKHQAGVVKKFNLPSWNLIPETNPAMRQTFYYIGTGQIHAVSWFQSSGDTNGSAESKPCSLVEEVHDQDLEMSESEAEETEELDILGVEESLRELFDDWRDKLKRDPDSYAKIFDVLVKNARKVQTVSQLSRAAHAFGKYSGFGLKGLRHHFIAKKRTGVQPAAFPPRKKALLSCEPPGLGHQ